MFRMIFVAAAMLATAAIMQSGHPSPCAAHARMLPSGGEVLVDRCLHNLSKLEWIHTQIVQEVNSSGVRMETKAEYVRAPGNKVSYHQDVSIGGAAASFKFISDGKEVWQVHSRAGKDAVKQAAYFTLADFKKAKEDLGKDNIYQQIRAELESECGFVGLHPLVADAQNRVEFTKVKKSTWTPAGGTPVAVYEIEGELNKETREQLWMNYGGPAMERAWNEKQPPFVMMPRACRVYLNQREPLWPHRIEWLGPTAPRGDNEVLAAVEFRNPILQAPADPKKWDAHFVVDLTEAERKNAVALKPAEMLDQRYKMIEQHLKAETQRRSMQPIDPTKR